MKILSWNILASKYIKKKYYPKIPEDILFSRHERFKKIYEIISINNPDVILLQEVMKLEYDALTEYLKNIYYISHLTPINNNNNNEIGNVTFLKKNMFKNVTHYPLDFGLYTSCLYNNKTCNIFNIHLNGKSENIRYIQLSSILPIITEKYCIVAGDFNHTYRKNSKLYNILSGFTTTNFCDTYYIKPKKNIDNILTRGFSSKQYICPFFSDNPEEVFKKYGSDHLPIQITLSI